MVKLSQIRELFLLAREVPNAEITAFLDVRCKGDIELRDELVQLLEADKAAPPDGGLIDGLGVARIASFELKPGDEVGHYRLIERCGAGGMGTVYKAEQRQVIRRTVAIKIINAGTDIKEVLARFEA